MALLGIGQQERYTGQMQMSEMLRLLTQTVETVQSFLEMIKGASQGPLFLTQPRGIFNYQAGDHETM